MGRAPSPQLKPSSALTGNWAASDLSTYLWHSKGRALLGSMAAFPTSFPVGTDFHTLGGGFLALAWAGTSFLGCGLSLPLSHTEESSTRGSGACPLPGDPYSWGQHLSKSLAISPVLVGPQEESLASLKLGACVTGLKWL